MSAGGEKVVRLRPRLPAARECVTREQFEERRGAGEYIAAPRISRWIAFWRRLGFSSRYPEEKPESFELLPLWMVTNVRLQASLGDRLRFLVSGRALVRVTTRHDLALERVESASSVEIEPPLGWDYWQGRRGERGR